MVWIGVKAWLVQLYGFLVKVFTQRAKTPITTLMEIILPCLFTLLMSIAYWTSDTETVPAKDYAADGQTPRNVTAITTQYGNFFCLMPGTSIKNTTFPYCTPPYLMYKCISTVGNGKELCMTYPNYGQLTGFMFSVYYLNAASVALNSMDAHLALSAFTRESTDNDDPTFFGRSIKASLSHYGKLLVSSDSEALAADFMDYCRSESGMCGSVLHPHIFPSFDAAQNYALEEENKIWAIVHLPQQSIDLSRSGPAEFTISMNYSANPQTFKESRQKKLFRGVGKQDGSDPFALYWGSGFLTLQTFIQSFYLDRNHANGVPQVGPAIYIGNRSMGGVKDYVNQYGAALFPMPTPKHYNNEFLTEWIYYMPLVAMMAALFPVARLTGLIVEEKSQGIREAMLIMGLSPSCMFGGWYASALVVDFVASLLAAMILKIGFLHYANYGVLLVLYFTFMQQNSALSIFLSTLFSNPRIASWCAAFVIFICAMPYYNFPEGMTTAAKKGVSLVPCVGYAQAFGILVEEASYGLHFGWDSARSGSYSVTIAIGMMWASVVTFLVFAAYLDQVWPAAVGRRKHPLFFLEPIVRCLKTDTIPLVTMKGSGVEEPLKGDLGDVQAGAKLPSSRMIEHYGDVVDPQDPAVAAVFQDLSKIYLCGGVLGYFYTLLTGLFRKGDRCVALDGVTFAMYTGEVSVLLGPNGAGKSTIMGMATGMIKPTTGEVFIRGHRASRDLSACRQNIGYCPQADIIWELLTVEEHLSFYARLKGSHTFNVQPAVDKAVELAGLTSKRHSRAGSLSGGQKRRLCVAIALVGDSSVLFLDEPTAGMDIEGRRSIYRVLNRARKDRSVLLCTHLLDEADRIGNRVLIVNNGRLCAEGSSPYLKSQVDVGYVITCVLDSDLGHEKEDIAVNALIDFVREKGYGGHHIDHDHEAVQAIPASCKLLGIQRRGREVSFRFPLALLATSGRTLLVQLREHERALHLRTMGLNLTTLDDVFLTLTGEAPLMSAAMMEAKAPPEEAREANCAPVEEIGPLADAEVTGTVANAEVTGTVADAEAMYHSGNSFEVFARHFRTLFLKRVHFAKRDVKLLLFQVVLPVLFLLISLLINLIRAPEQPSLLLDMSMYPGYETHPSQMLASLVSPIPHFLMPGLGLSTSTPAVAYGRAYNPEYVHASPYSTNGTMAVSHALMESLSNHSASRYVALAPDGYVFGFRPVMAATVFHNTSADHASAQAVNALYNLATYQLYGDQVPQLVARNRPMKIGRFESQLVDASKQVIIGIFVILPFVFIPSNTISYIVREKESGARLLQWMSGASVAAYWLSSFVFDALCYIGTEILVFILFVIFDRSEYVNKDQIGPAIVLFLVFGISSIPFSYFLSFFFSSPFTAQSVVLIVNFVFGFLWVTIESFLAPSAYNFVRGVTFVLRVFPSVCFGEGMFVLAGTELGLLMYPRANRPDLFSLIKFKPGGGFSGGIGTGLIYMCCVFLGSFIGLVVFEYARVQRLLNTSFCGLKHKKPDREALMSHSESTENAASMIDESVIEEEQRVCAVETGPEEDSIAFQHVSKRYIGARHKALEDFSLGVHRGEVIGLLGLNGAGKTTAITILAGDTIASSGSAYVNHISVLRSASRSFVGYCPQYDHLLDNLSAVEHLWLYARLRGMREEYIPDEVRTVISGLGLHPYRNQPASTLSGGNKRRLSLAIALVGRTTSVLLDEPTAGMDALARMQTCAMVRGLTMNKSIILSTHLLDEAEALAHRVAFIARGGLRCLGTPQELKHRFTKDTEFSITVLFPRSVDFLEAETTVPGKMLEYIAQTLAAEEGTKRSCTIAEVASCSIVFTARGELADICEVIAALRENRVDGIPPVEFVSVSQPTLEDILLQESLALESQSNSEVSTEK